MSGAIKHDFRTYIRLYTSPNKNFAYGYPHSNALLQFPLKLKRCKLHKAASHPTECDVINDVKLFLTVYCRINCHNFFTLSNQMSHYKSKCIRNGHVGRVEILRLFHLCHCVCLGAQCLTNTISSFLFYDLQEVWDKWARCLCFWYAQVQYEHGGCGVHVYFIDLTFFSFNLFPAIMFCCRLLLLHIFECINSRSFY